ncbi:hypothetical protein [Archangium sp. Cb G35]|uniref:hypothetical protein n=1 Tax=Archangium sp. Cb G35 TaxID=1920190 RepID=UPI000AA5B57A|nr:hypothetical protein [Archangium sp. Cb G35]
MRVAWIPRLLVVLGLLGGGLLWLVPRFEILMNGTSPWTPPEPAVAGLPADTTQALQALAVHGSVPECQAHAKEEGEDDAEEHVHRHIIVPVEPLARLEGQAEKIRSYLGHPSEPVVYRAASLLCFIQDRPSRRALEWLESRYPRRPWVRQIMAGAGLVSDEVLRSRRAVGYQAEYPKAGHEALSSLPNGSSPSPEALALARRISEGDASAVRQALQFTQAMELARRPDGGHALRQVSTPRGLALVYQAILERWEAEVLSYSTVSPHQQREWKEGPLEGMGLEILMSVRGRTGKAREAVLVETVGLMPESLREPMYAAIKQDTSLFREIARFARSPEGQEVTEVTARAFMERLEQEDTREQAQKREAMSEPIIALFRAGDVAALKQVAAFDMNNPFRPLQQSLAASYLLALGEHEEFALGTLEASHLTLRIPERNIIRGVVKLVLDEAKSGATKKRLQRIYERLSRHCQGEDCSVERPR